MAPAETSSRSHNSEIREGSDATNFWPFLPFRGGVNDFFPKASYRSIRFFGKLARPPIPYSNPDIRTLEIIAFSLRLDAMNFSCKAVALAYIGEPHHVYGSEIYYRCPNHDDQHPSLKINVTKDKWLCGPCGASGGAWALAAFLARIGANEKQAVMKSLEDHGLAYSKHEKLQRPKAEEFHFVKAFYYTPILRNVRFETTARNGEKPNKKFQWQHLEDKEWKPGSGGMTKPLYVNERFRKGEPFGIAVGFEGEGKCDLAGELGIPAFSYKYMSKAECQKLAGLEIILWPDADQAGFVQAKNAALMLKEAKLKVRMCSIPIEFIVGGDIVDAVRTLKWTRKEIDEFLALATPYPIEVLVGKVLRRVEAKKLEWLWKNRVPCNGITILDGDPGTGKGLLTTDLAARITTGRPLPFDDFQMPPANVIVLSSEDSLEHTIRPRFEAANADLDRIIAVPYSSEKAGEPCFTRLPRDLKILSKAIDQQKAKLVIIDVLVSYIPAELSTRNDQDVRLALAPLAELCDKKNIACICNRHLNKTQGGSAIYRGGGSIGITGAARSVLLLAHSKENHEQRTLAVVKSNLGVLPSAASFAIRSKGEVPYLEWLQESNLSADELLVSGIAKGGEEQVREARLNEAMQFLLSMLGEGNALADDILKEARDQCIYRSRLFDAKAVLRVKSYRKGGRWWWELPRTH
jgi:hypothetical protein